jgi:hypothetical protein
MDESLLVRKDGDMENDNEKTSWVEYYLDDELVHRSVHVELKQPLLTETIIGEM